MIKNFCLIHCQMIHLQVLGELAQLVERLHGMQEASGSNPLFSTWRLAGKCQSACKNS